METVIKNGRIITAFGEYDGSLLMREGRIAACEHEDAKAHAQTEQLCDEAEKNGAQVYDAEGCLVFPGFIDGHTHLQMPVAGTVTADDFESGTAAALAGGTTTIVDFATQERGGSLAEALELWHSRADGHCWCDYGFHMAITDWNEQTRKELSLMPAAGVTSFKLYMAYDALRVNDGAIYEILREVRDIGGIVSFHCENGDLVNTKIRENLADGMTDPYWHAESRPDICEAEAISRACYMAEAARAPLNIVHVSTARGLGEAMRARARGVRVFAETCPQYLLLDESLYNEPDFGGAKYVCSPPLRRERDRRALWGGVGRGQISTISTDHCSFNFKGQKELGRDDFSKIPNGLPGIESRPALIFTHGVATGRLPAGRMAALLSENIARLYGMFPRKGALLKGADADVVVWDPEYHGVLSAATQHMKCDYTPYEGMEIIGRPRAVFLGGELAAENGEPLRRSHGRYIERGSSEN